MTYRDYNQTFEVAKLNVEADQVRCIHQLRSFAETKFDVGNGKLQGFMVVLSHCALHNGFDVTETEGVVFINVCLVDNRAQGLVTIKVIFLAGLIAVVDDTDVCIRARHEFNLTFGFATLLATIELLAQAHFVAFSIFKF